MKFDKYYKVEWWTVNKSQAEAFIRFLDMERDRHSRNIDEAENIIESEEWWKKSPDLNATVELWESAVKRHQKDIEDIDVLIKSVKHWFEI